MDQAKSMRWKITKFLLDAIRYVYQLKTTEVEILSSHKQWDRGTLSFLMITFQKNGFQFFQKTLLNSRRYIHISKTRKIHNCKPFLIDALWKKRDTETCHHLTAKRCNSFRRQALRGELFNPGDVALCHRKPW